MQRAPFIFCRYSAQIDDEELDPGGLLEALSEIQGQYLPHGRKAEKDGRADVVVMRPRRVTIHSEDVVTWAIGHKPGHRVVTSYDPDNEEIQDRIRSDDHILRSEIVAIPRLGVMAVGDRQSTVYMGGKVALSRTRSAFRFMEGGHFAFWYMSPDDITAMLNVLKLQEYSYTVRRINPHPPGVLAAALDASMEAEGIGILRGVAKPDADGEMGPDEGLIGQSSQLATGGYGVVGFKGETEDGSTAQIRKPPFSLDKAENLKQMEKAQPLRVLIEENDAESVIPSVVAELVRFYDGDQATGIPEEPA